MILESACLRGVPYPLVMDGTCGDLKMSLLPIGRALVADTELHHLLYVSETLKLLGVPDVETYNDPATAGRRAGAAKFDLAIVACNGDAPIPAQLAASGALVVAMAPAAVLRAFPFLAQSLGVDLVIAAPFTRSGLYAQLATLLEGAAGRRLKVVELPVRARALAPVADSRPHARVTLSRGRAGR
jgi:hypothetical protein